MSTGVLLIQRHSKLFYDFMKIPLTSKSMYLNLCGRKLFWITGGYRKLMCAVDLSGVSNVKCKQLDLDLPRASNAFSRSFFRFPALFFE